MLSDSCDDVLFSLTLLNNTNIQAETEPKVSERRGTPWAQFAGNVQVEAHSLSSSTAVYPPLTRGQLPEFRVVAVERSHHSGHKDVSIGLAKNSEKPKDKNHSTA